MRIYRIAMIALLIMSVGMGLMLTQAQDDVEPTIAALMDSIVMTATADAELGLEATAQARLNSGQQEASTVPSNTVRVSPFSTILEGYQDVTDIAFSPDGSLLAGIGDADGNGIITFWDATSGTETTILTTEDIGVGRFYNLNNITFSPDGRYLAIAADADDGGYTYNIYIWDIASQNVYAVLRGHGDIVLALDFNPDGSWLASGSRDGTIKIWSMADRRELATLSGHEDWSNAVSFNSDGSLLASSGNNDDTIRIWDMQTGFERDIVTVSNTANNIVFSPTANKVAYAVATGFVEVYLWDVDEIGEPLLLGEFRGGAVVDLAFSPDGAFVAIAADNDIYIHDVATGLEVTLVQQGANVQGLEFSADGTRLAAGSVDGTARIWNLVFEE